MPTEFNPSEYLDVAKEVAAEALSDSELHEAKLRVALGRAYYAIVLLGCRKVCIASEERGKHKKLISAFMYKSTLYGSMIASLQELRVQADYFTLTDLRYEDWEANWKNAVDYAEKLELFIADWK